MIGDDWPGDVTTKPLGHWRSELANEWYGLYFGYPRCCTDAFNERCSQFPVPEPPSGPWIGTGFIPCDRCAAMIRERGLEWFVAEQIEPFRICIGRFPDGEPIARELTRLPEWFPEPKETTGE